MGGMEISIGDEFEVVGASRPYLKIVTGLHFDRYGQPDGWRLERHVVNGVERAEPFSWECEATLLDPEEYWRRPSTRVRLQLGPNFFAGAGFYWVSSDGTTLRVREMSDEHLHNTFDYVGRNTRRPGPDGVRNRAALRILGEERARRQLAPVTAEIEAVRSSIPEQLLAKACLMLRSWLNENRLEFTEAAEARRFLREYYRTTP